MSVALLKRSLDLFEDDEDKSTGAAAKKIAKKSKPGSKGRERATLKKQINTKKSEKYKIDSKNSPAEDRTEQSLQFLQRLSKVNKTDGQVTKAILTYNKGRLSKNAEKMEPVDNSTVFNERDFDKFEEEYDFFS